MDQQLESARSDLAFLKAVVEDRGALPAILGWHLVAIGVIWGLDFLHIWAIFAGVAPWPEALRWIPWLPGLIVYLPVNLLLNRRARGAAWGPGARVFGASWAAMVIMIPPAVAVLLIGEAQTGHPFYLVWPALAFVLYGGAWTIVALVRRGIWQGAVAAGCFAAAALSARLIGDLAQWPVIAVGLMLLVALPGAVIVRSAARDEWIRGG